MTNFEKIASDYWQKRQHYETKIDAVLITKNKGLQIIEELAQTTYYYVNSITDEPAILNDGLQALYSLSDELKDDCQQELKQLDQQLEELETNYRHQLQNET